MYLIENMRDYYDASDQLRVVDRRTCPSQPNNPCSEQFEPGQDHRGAFESYRYDALDRRVLVRSLTDSACFYQFCPHTLERTVWDGNQVLYEMRYRGGNSSLATEPDTVTIPDTVSGLLYRPYGRVAYTNGPTLDQPLDIIRMGFDPPTFTNPIVLIPHVDWHGRYDVGSYDDGSKNRCTNYSDITTCITIYWPAPYLYVQYESKNNGLDGFKTWFGERLAGVRDGCGQMYMRNRYYDPTTGRFTQEDPIGLAGGLNAYGFAAGDPVNFDDPFGLCPVEQRGNCTQSDVSSTDIRNAAGTRGAVKFVGLTGSLFVGGGATASGGLFFSPSGSGPYLHVGGGPGIDVAAGLEGGLSKNLNAFRGKSVGGCGGILGGGICGLGNKSGWTVAGNATVGTRDLPLPVSNHAEPWSYTFAPTWTDLGPGDRSFECAKVGTGC